MGSGRQSKFGVKGSRQGKVTVWRGVPYASAPEGPRRFQPPQPSPPWDGPRNATDFGPSSISTDVPGLVLPSGSGVVPESEDCLYLNVWSPRTRGKARPVLVWLHGGAFVFGSGSNFDGAWLANRGDAVIVTINYRLGPWGFLDLAATGGAGLEGSVNVGMLDQVAALQWVSDNIEAFGGDPNRVTVIGQASGATCVGALLAMPAAAGLFHRAVMQSGAADRVQSRWRSRAVVVRMLNSLGVDYREVSELRELSVDAIREAAGSLMRDSDDAELEGEPFLPVVDGTVLPGHPMAGLVSGASSQIPLLISTCQQEANLYLAISPEGYIKAKELRARAWFGDVAWERLIRTYQKGFPQDRGRADLLTDLLFGIPAVRTAEAHNRGGGRSWIMRFDHTPGQVPFDQLGPCHGADLPFTWLDFTGPTEGAFPGLSTNADRTVAELLQDVILNFARVGDPGTAALPAWPAYQPGRRAIMSIQSRPALELDPAAERRRAWDALPLPQTLNVRRSSGATRSSEAARLPGATSPTIPTARTSPAEPTATDDRTENDTPRPQPPATADTRADSPAPASPQRPGTADTWAAPAPDSAAASPEPPASADTWADPAAPEAPGAPEPPDAVDGLATPAGPELPAGSGAWVVPAAPANAEEPVSPAVPEAFDGGADAPADLEPPTGVDSGAGPVAPDDSEAPARLAGFDWFDRPTTPNAPSEPTPPTDAHGFDSPDAAPDQ
ncbi:MAG: para-nitrobenzyl esterase [Acidimicrobiaceae bacterium]|nr:para-nitrobenzyl esterase [Acidimicrobiaceae bacterium]